MASVQCEKGGQWPETLVLVLLREMPSSSSSVAAATEALSLLREMVAAGAERQRASVQCEKGGQWPETLVPAQGDAVQ